MNRRQQGFVAMQERFEPDLGFMSICFCFNTLLVLQRYPIHKRCGETEQHVDVNKS